MKKILVGMTLFILTVAAGYAERLFDYRGVFPAERPATAKITNYMLLKKDTAITFEIEEQGKGVSNRIIIPRIKLTSDEKVVIEKAEGLGGLRVPETGIYEITLVPQTTDPGEIRFILKVFESALTDPGVASAISVIPPLPVTAPATTPVDAAAMAPALTASQTETAPVLPVATAADLSLLLPQASGTPPMQTTASPASAVSDTSAVSTQTADVLLASAPVSASASLQTPENMAKLISPKPGSFMNPFNGIRVEYDDVSFVAADKLSQMFSLFLRKADGSEFPVKARRFSPEPDILVFTPEKILPGAVYNLSIADESLSTRKFFMLPALPEVMIEFSQTPTDVKARVFWHQSIDLMPTPAGQVQNLNGCALVIYRESTVVSRLEINEALPPVGQAENIQYRAQPFEFEITLPLSVFEGKPMALEVKALIDGGTEPVTIRKGVFQPEIAGDEPEAVEEKPASENNGSDFSDAPAVDHEATASPVTAEIEEIISRESLDASTTFSLEKSFAVVSEEAEKLNAWPQSVAWGETGGLWVLDSQLFRVSRFNLNGSLVKAFGAKGGADGQFGLPVAIAVKDGKIYVADSTKRGIHILNEDGSFAGAISGDPATAAKIDLPSSVCFRKNEIWVADRAQARILCFNDQGAFLGSFASTAAAPIVAPVSIRADADSLFFLESNGLVKKFSPMGSFDATFQSGCSESTGFDVDPWGGIWVCDPVKFMVHRFSRNGKILTSILPPPGPRPWVPTSVAVRRDGKVAITDAQNKMVHIFSPVR